MNPWNPLSPDERQRLRLRFEEIAGRQKTVFVMPGICHAQKEVFNFCQSVLVANPKLNFPGSIFRVDTVFSVAGPSVYLVMVLPDDQYVTFFQCITTVTTSGIDIGCYWPPEYRELLGDHKTRDLMVTTEFLNFVFMNDIHGNFGERMERYNTRQCF